MWLFIFKQALSAFISSAVSKALGTINSILNRNRDTELGELKANSTVQTQVLKDVEVKNSINNVVDTSTDVDVKRMSDGFDNADK